MLKNKKRIGLLALAVCALLQTGVTSAASLSLSPASVNAVESGTFDVDVILSDLGTDIVGGLKLTIGYDPSLLSATNVAFSGNLGSTDPFDFETLAGFDVSTPGLAVFDETSLLFSFELDALQPGDSLRLATLSFLAESVGTAALFFTALTTSKISDDFGAEIEITEFQGASVDISPIPLPGALWLMITGLLGIRAMMRRRVPVTQ